MRRAAHKKSQRTLEANVLFVLVGEVSCSFVDRSSYWIGGCDPRNHTKAHEMNLSSEGKPRGPGNAGALVAQGANSNGWLEDETVVSRFAGGSNHHRSRSVFHILRRLTNPPLIGGPATWKTSNHKLCVSLARSVSNDCLPGILESGC
jgi:hypothetical protein